MANVNNDTEEKLKQYTKALKLCTEAKDSACVGSSLEQMSSIYGQLKNYEKAHEYFNLALPYLEKFADRMQMATSFNNYSNLLSFEGKHSEAMQYIDSALFIAREQKNTYKETMYLNNKASVYTDMGENDKGIAIFKECIDIDKQNHYEDHLLNDYSALAETYEDKKDFRSALEYYKLHDTLNDSLRGEDVKLKIAELNAKYEPQSKELELEKKQFALAEANQSVSKRTFIIAFILLFVVAGIIMWRWQLRKNKQELKQHKENLNELTNMLLQKNTQLTELEEELSNRETIKIQAEHTNGFENNLYNQHILTDADWKTFKMSFEKAYPGYLPRLRTNYKVLSESEERLFLFIKLNLKSKEIASILGISVDSVKKTRSRLRKRLELGEDVDLEEYILGF